MFGSPYYAPYQYPYYAQNVDLKPQINQPIQNIPQQSQNVQNTNFLTKSDMIWVLNKNEADSYPVAPNCSVVLWDKNSQTIYIKSMNASGIPSMETLDYTRRAENPVKSPTTNEKVLEDKFVTIDQFNDLKGNFDDLKAMYDKLATQKSTKSEEKPKTASKKSQSEEE